MAAETYRIEIPVVVEDLPPRIPVIPQLFPVLFDGSFIDEGTPITDGVGLFRDSDGLCPRKTPMRSRWTRK